MEAQLPIIFMLQARQTLGYQQTQIIELLGQEKLMQMEKFDIQLFIITSHIILVLTEQVGV